MKIFIQFRRKITPLPLRADSSLNSFELQQVKSNQFPVIVLDQPAHSVKNMPLKQQQAIR